MPTAFDRLIAPARRRPALWRLALGLLLVAALWTLAVVGLFAAAFALGGAEAFPDRLARLEEGRDPWAVTLVLLTFAGPFAGALLAARLLHGRAPGTLFGPRGRVLRDLAGAAAIVAVVYALGLALWELRFDSRPGLPSGAWALWLAPALAAVALQTGAEELVFRGYLQSQLAARFASPFAWAVAPSLLFGAVHWDPGAPLPVALAIMGSAALFGLIAADLTARTGSIGAAWGLHLANNAFALLVLATPGSLPGLALRLTPYDADDPVMTPMLVGDVATLLLVWALCRWALAPPAARPRAGARAEAGAPAPASRRGA